MMPGNILSGISRIDRPIQLFALTTLIGLAIIFLAVVLPTRISSAPQVALIVGGLAIISTGIVAAMYIYLRGPIYELAASSVSVAEPISTISMDEGRIAELLDERLKQAVDDIGKTTSVLQNHNDRTELVDAIKSAVIQDLGTSIGAESDLYLRKLPRSTQFSEVRTIHAETISRLKREVSDLGRRANVNLLIGGVTSLIAVGLLIFMVLTSNVQRDNILDLLWHFIPRLSIVIFIEVFSFFFLRLYRTTLNEIKYFQNELTNVDLKFAGLEASLALEDSTAISSSIQEFTQTERNFVLKKDESTVDLQRLRIENQSLKEVIDSLKGPLTKVLGNER